jgi:hypothetical protein
MSRSDDFVDLARRLFVVEVVHFHLVLVSQVLLAIHVACVSPHLFAVSFKLALPCSIDRNGLPLAERGMTQSLGKTVGKTPPIVCKGNRYSFVDEIPTSFFYAPKPAGVGQKLPGGDEELRRPLERIRTNPHRCAVPDPAGYAPHSQLPMMR